MDLKTIRSLTRLMQEYDLMDLEVESSDLKVKLSKARPEAVAQPMAMMPAAAPVPAAGPAQAGGAAEAEASLASCHEVISPLPGTYYARPNPDASDFVSMGDQVEEGQVLCLVEAMKVFNEIKADRSGTIKKICLEEGQAVEYGTVLFLIG